MSSIQTKAIAATLLVLSLSACGPGGDNDKTEAADTGSAEATREDSAVLITATEWKGWKPPAELEGYALRSFGTDPFSNVNLYSALAVYRSDDTFIQVQLVDGSTDKGRKEIRDHLAIAGLERDYSSEYGYEKTLERNGLKAKEEYLAPPAGQYLIKFMLEDRFGVSVKSDAETVEEIWNFVDRLGLADLEG